MRRTCACSRACDGKIKEFLSLWCVFKETFKISSWEILKRKLLYSWRFSHYSVPFHWLVHGHMTSNNETFFFVSRQMPWAGNIAKTMTSNGKQFTVTREMLTAVAGISARFSKFAFVLFCYITNHLMTGPLGNSEFCFPRISMFPSTSSRETLRFSGNKIHCSPRDQSLSVNYYPDLLIDHTMLNSPAHTYQLRMDFRFFFRFFIIMHYLQI